MGHLGSKDFLWIPRPRLALTRAPILDPSLSPKNEDAPIELVVDHAIAALGIAVDRRCVPAPASGAWYTARIQIAHNCPRRLAGGVPPKDISDDFGLIRNDISQPPDRFADGVEFSPNLVAVDMSARVTTGPDDALEATPRLSACLAQLKGVHGAHQPDLKLRYVAFGDRADP